MSDSLSPGIGMGAGREAASAPRQPEGAIRQTTWDVLLRRVAAGDQNAMAELYDETSQVVYSTLLRLLRNPSDAEEVAMDIYSQVWRTAASYDPARGSVFSWLLRIARTRAIDRIRARRATDKARGPIEGADNVQDASETPDRLSEVSERRDRVRAAIAQLPPEQKTCIEMAFYSGLSHSELAEQLGEPLGTVKTRIRSGMGKLRSWLGEYA